MIKNFFKVMVRLLELEDNCFIEMCGEKFVMEIRFNVYFLCLRLDKVIGFKFYFDGLVFIFFLLDKNVEGF